MEKTGIDLNKYKQAIEDFIDETTLEKDKDERREIGCHYSERFVANKKIGDKSIVELFDTILHYYFRNFYDQDAFVSKNRELRGIMYAHTLEEKEKWLTDPQKQDYEMIDLYLRDTFSIYRDCGHIVDLFNLCLDIYIKEGRMNIKVEMVLNLLLANVIRGYSTDKDDFFTYTNLLNKIKHYEIVPFDEQDLLQEMGERLDRFLVKAKENKNAQYIFELYDQVEDSDNKEPTPEQLETALESFKNTFNSIKDSNLYFIKFDQEIKEFMVIHGITLYSGKVLISKGERFENPEKRTLWFTFVLIHELCHLFRLVRADYAVEKSTPKKWMCEAGINCTIEILGSNVGNPVEVVEYLKKRSGLQFLDGALENPFPPRYYYGDPKKLMPKIKAFFNEKKSKNEAESKE